MDLLYDQRDDPYHERPRGPFGWARRLAGTEEGACQHPANPLAVALAPGRADAEPPVSSGMPSRKEPSRAVSMDTRTHAGDSDGGCFRRVDVDSRGQRQSAY
jgi:hypothetical protein